MGHSRLVGQAQCSLQIVFEVERPSMAVVGIKLIEWQRQHIVHKARCVLSHDRTPKCHSHYACYLGLSRRVNIYHKFSMQASMTLVEAARPGVALSDNPHV